MSEQKSAESFKKKRFWKITPPNEKLWEKIIGLEETVARHGAEKMDDAQRRILKTCENYLGIARGLITANGPSHPHLIWSLLHRVDEHLILLMSKEELSARVIDVITAFDLTIKEEPVRKAWLGEKGKLQEALHDITGEGRKMEQSRHLVKEALQYLDDFVDYGFWKLSMNSLMSVSSALLLALFSLVFFGFYREHCKELLNLLEQCDLRPIAVLGLIGGYLSNLLTREDFLFVWGGPFVRYLLYNLLARPVIGAFSAIFFFLVERSKLVFSINATEESAKAVQSTLITINVSKEHAVYVYIVLAVAVGFAGEKMLRQMMDSVLKRLEKKAEKTKETGKDGKDKKETQ